jgi:hypothetical protein
VRGPAALDGGNVNETVSLAHRAVACGACGEELGLLRVLEAQALSMRADWLECVEAQREALGLLPVGSTPWFVAASGLLLSGSFLGDMNITALALRAVLGVTVQPEASGPYGFAVCCACQGLVQLGQIESARSFLGRAEAMRSGPLETDPLFGMGLRISRAVLQLTGDDLGSALRGLSPSRRRRPT